MMTSPSSIVPTSHNSFTLTLLSDLQITSPAVGFDDHRFIDRVVPTALRSFLSTITAPLYNRVLLHLYAQPEDMIVLMGDQIDSPEKRELWLIKKIIEAFGIDVAMSILGNHDLENLLGVLKTQSPMYQKFVTHLWGGRDILSEEAYMGVS